MSKERTVSQSLAVMRDQKIVFYGVRDVLNAALTAEDSIAKIREYYDAFDESHPASGETA